MIKKTFFPGVLLACSLLTACGQLYLPATVNSDAQLAGKADVLQQASKQDSKYPGELLYYLLVAEIAGKQGLLSVSAQAYQKAIVLSSDFHIARRAVQVAVFARKYSFAINAAKRWIELKPDDPDAQQSLALLYVRIRQPESALQQLIALIEIAMAKGADTGNQEFLRVGTLLHQMPPDSMQNNRLKQNDKLQLLKVMSQFVEHFTENPYALIAYSRLAFQLRDLPLASEKIDQALKLDPELEIANVLRADILMALGKSGEALRVMEKVLASTPEKKNLLITYARMLAEAGQYDNSRIQFEKLLAKSPEDSELLYALALLSIETRQYETAENYLQSMLKMGERQSEAHYFLGSIAESRGQYDKAIQWFSQVRDGAQLIDAHLRLATLIGKQGDINKALNYLKRLQATDSALAIRVIIAQIDILNNAQRFQEAMDVANQALKRFPGNLSLYYLRSLLADSLNELTLAEHDLRRVLEKEPDHPNALNALGYMLADRTDRYQEALGYVQRALDQLPDQPAYIDSMGWVQYRLGNFDEALRYLRKAFEMDQDSEIAAHLGEVLWRTGDHAGARLIWQAAQKKDPNNKKLQDVIERFEQSLNQD